MSFESMWWRAVILVILPSFLSGCPFPEPECDGSATIPVRECRGAEVWRCNTAGFYAPIEDCSMSMEGGTCAELSSKPGGAGCIEGAGNSEPVPTECVANRRFCVGDAIWSCNPAGEPTGVFQNCADTQKTCMVQAGVAQCFEDTSAQEE